MQNEPLNKLIQFITPQEHIFASASNHLYKSVDNGKIWTLDCICDIDPIEKLCSISTLTQRFFRVGIYQAVMLSSGTRILICAHRIYRAAKEEKLASPVFNIRRWARPLVLCPVSNGSLYWGEYFKNSKRSEVYVYGSDDDGQSFHIAYTFPSKSIRHIHGIFYDSYDDKIWITTGDRDEECAIWLTDDNFRSVQKVSGGNQQFRVGPLLFNKTHIYFGSDTPEERNHIYRLNRKTNNLKQLQVTANSIFRGCKVGDALFFATIIDRSKTNPSLDAQIWGSSDGLNWKQIAKFGKDLWPTMPFLYGQIFFPTGDNNTGYLWFTPFATQKHLTLQKIAVKTAI
jgi:hypothetical protein